MTVPARMHTFIIRMHPSEPEIEPRTQVDAMRVVTLHITCMPGWQVKPSTGHQPVRTRMEAGKVVRESDEGSKGGGLR